MCNAEIDGLSQLSSGTYKCEVSEDAPEFKLIDQTANMTVGGRLNTITSIFCVQEFCHILKSNKKVKKNKDLKPQGDQTFSNYKN